MIDDGYGLALVDGAVFEKDSSIKFRILAVGSVRIVLKQYALVGLGIKKIIVKNNYDIKDCTD